MILSAMLAATIMLADTTPAAAAAVTTPAAEAAKAAPAKAEKPKMVCRTEAVTGSMFPKKTCYNVEDFAQRQQEERKNLQIMQNTQKLNGN